MSETAIPEDIQKVAANIVANWLLQPSAEPYVVAISAAILAERERCLNVALEWATDVRNPHGSRITAGHIAADIRNPKP